MGGPVSVANPATEKTIPILTPDFFGSIVSDATVAGNSDCTPAAQEP